MGLTEAVTGKRLANQFTEAVKNNRLLKFINRGGLYKRPARENQTIFGGWPLKMACLG
jgi:hypothetical protein